MLAATVRVTRDLDAAEEAVQDAYVQALRTWARDGVPERPGAWLTTVARRNALNVLRHRQTLATKLPLLLETQDTAMPEPDTATIPDDRLRLIFTCCHPALAQEAQIALTLRLVCGVATRDVAKAFLVAEATMAARLTRAKKKITVARIPYRVPSPDDLPERVDAVLTVIHLLYTTGHTAHSGEDLVRDELTARALDLAHVLRLLLPTDREAAGLLALLLVHHARRATRTDAQGRLLRLEEQDRSAWDRDLIVEADRLVVGALRAGPPGRFTLQAAIAALHAQAPSYAETDWPQILQLYGELLRTWPSPVVALNRAVATSMVDGPEAALAEVEALERDDRLAGYRYLPATKADLLHRLGRDTEAAEAYQAALALSDNAAEQEFLADRVRSTGGPRCTLQEHPLRGAQGDPAPRACHSRATRLGSAAEGARKPV
ncbi:MAG: polymerase sigma-70 factor, subfamily [Conexibacter sp.]|nr:polymerase sigma-70 factor, subfamily [Conexibacter sp.]